MNVAALSAQLDETVAIQLATAADDLVPQSVRGFAARYDGGSGVLTLGVIDAQSATFRATLPRAGRLAANLTNPVTFKGLQVKGPLVALEEPSDEATTAARDYFTGFLAALTGVGFRREQLVGLYCPGPARWVRMRPVEIYNQTPGPGAGAAL